MQMNSDLKPYYYEQIICMRIITYVVIVEY